MHSQVEDTQCLYALVVVEPKIDQVQTAKKVTIINLRFTAKPHAHLQTLTKDPGKVVKGVAFTRVDIFCVTDSQMDARGKTICLPTLTVGDST